MRGALEALLRVNEFLEAELSSSMLLFARRYHIEPCTEIARASCINRFALVRQFDGPPQVHDGASGDQRG